MRFLIRLLVLLACVPHSHARIGLVRTTSGKQLEGHVRFTKGGVTIVNPSANFVVNLPTTNVSEVAFPLSAAASAETLGTQGLPPGWRDIEIGSSQPAASTICERDAFTVRGAGTSIDAESDSFHYVFQQVRGDREIIARVSMIQHTAPEAKAGIMMRESLSDVARAVTISGTAQLGGFFQARHFEGRATQSVPQPDIRVGTWLKLRRRGNDFSAFKSENGRQWTLVEQVQMPMREEYYLGLAVASGRADTLCWTRFDRVREGVKLLNGDFTPQIELVSGSVISGRPSHANTKEFVFSDGIKVVPVETPRVARVIYQPMTSQIAWRSRGSSPGVWVHGGDFFEGDFQEIVGDKLRVSSVLYGIRTFDVDEEVVAAVLASAARKEPKVELDVQDGSRLIGEHCSFGDGEVVLSELALGEVRVPAYQIRELRVR